MNKVDKLAHDVNKVTIDLRNYRIQNLLKNFYGKKKTTGSQRKVFNLLEKKLRSNYTIDILLEECELIM